MAEQPGHLLQRREANLRAVFQGTAGLGVSDEATVLGFQSGGFRDLAFRFPPSFRALCLFGVGGFFSFSFVL